MDEVGKKDLETCPFCHGTGLRCPQLACFGLTQICLVCHGYGMTGPHPRPTERVVDLNERRLEGA